jgi:hypothetical protein
MIIWFINLFIYFSLTEITMGIYWEKFLKKYMNKRLNIILVPGKYVN